MRKYILVGIALMAAGSAYAADVSNFSIATVKQGTPQNNGTSCLYVTGFIPAEVGPVGVPYTLLVGSKSGDLVAATMVLVHRTINFDNGPANSQCQEFDGFAGVPSIVRPGAP